MNKFKHRFWTGLKIINMVLFAFITLVPFYWVLVSSFKPNDEIFGKPFALPAAFSVDGFRQAWESIDVLRTLGNSLFYCITAIFFILLFGSMVSYILAKVRPDKKLYAYFSFGLLIPIHAVIIPLNILFNQMGLNNSRTGLVLVFIVANLSLTIYVCTAAMRNLPDDIIQAAQIDGCNRVNTYLLMVLPISKSALATAGTLAFVNCWNDFLLSLTIATTRDIQTLNLAVFNLRSTYAKDYNILAAGLTTMIIPAVAVYSLFQEQIIKGMVSGAVKG